MMFYCRKRTHFLPPSLTILRWGELDILGVQDSKIGVYETIINKFSDLISKLLRIRDIVPNDLEILFDNIDMWSFQFWSWWVADTLNSELGKISEWCDLSGIKKNPQLPPLTIDGTVLKDYDNLECALACRRYGNESTALDRGRYCNKSTAVDRGRYGNESTR